MVNVDLLQELHEGMISRMRTMSHKGMISLRELQSATGEELDALLPSVLRPPSRPSP